MSTLSPVESALLVLFRGGHIVGLTPHAHAAPSHSFASAMAQAQPQPVALPVPRVAPIAALPASNPVQHAVKRGRPLGSRNKPKAATATTTTTQVQRAPAPIVEGDFDFDDVPAPAPIAPVLKATVAAPKAAPVAKPIATAKPKAAPAKAAPAPLGTFDATDIIAALDALSASVGAGAMAPASFPTDDLDYDL